MILGRYSGFVGEGLKGQIFELHREGRVLHFKSSGDFPVGLKLVNRPAKKVPGSPGVSGFKPVTPVPLRFQLQHGCAHPLRNNSRFCVGLEQQGYRQVKRPRDYNFLPVVGRRNVGFMLHGCLVFGFMGFHDTFQAVEPVVPEFTEGLEEVGYFFHFPGVEVIVYFPAVLFLLQ
jgi:hypothetical protein